MWAQLHSGAFIEQILHLTFCWSVCCSPHAPWYCGYIQINAIVISTKQKSSSSILNMSFRKHCNLCIMSCFLHAPDRHSPHTLSPKFPAVGVHLQQSVSHCQVNSNCGKCPDQTVHRISWTSLVFMRENGFSIPSKSRAGFTHQHWRFSYICRINCLFVCTLSRRQEHLY